MSTPVLPTVGDGDPSAMYAVSGQQLADIADAIRLKRDIATPMTVEDMPLQIGLIDSSGGTNYEWHTVIVDLTEPDYAYNIVGRYADALEVGYFYSNDPDESRTFTICSFFTDWTRKSPFPVITPQGVTLYAPYQVYVNDQTARTVRMRTGLAGKSPVGSYTIAWLGTAK